MALMIGLAAAFILGAFALFAWAIFRAARDLQAFEDGQRSVRPLRDLWRDS